MLAQVAADVPRHLLDRAPFMRLLGVQRAFAEGGRAPLTLASRADLGNVIGAVHGGPVVTLTLDTAFVGPGRVAIAADATWKNLGELLADARTRPGEISWGNVGAISVNHIVDERLARANGTRFNMIPFKGGKVRLLASFTERRLQRFPEVPTARELGQDFVIDSPVGLVAPKNRDTKLAARLGAAFRKAANDPAYLAQWDQFDRQPAVTTGEVYSACARSQFEREQKMLAEIGFTPE